MKRAQDFARNAPVTVTLAVLGLLGSVAAFFKLVGIDDLAYVSGQINDRPWTLFTYFAVDHPVMMALSIYMIFQYSPALEQKVGRWRYVLLILAILGAGAVGVTLAAWVLKSPASIRGGSTLAGPILVLWGVHYHNVMISVFGTKPIRAYWIAVLGIALFIGVAHPFAAMPFASLALLVAYLFGSNRIRIFRFAAPAVKTAPMGRGIANPKDDYYAEAERRKKEREDRERLRKLFESSVKDPEDRER